MFEVKPALIIETGTYRGGSAYYFVSICDLLGSGQVMTIDRMGNLGRPTHPRIEYVKGSSVDPEVLALVKERVAVANGPILVVLDSDHHEPHVRKELEAYHEFVTPGSYLIVEDTNINGHPVNPFFVPGRWRRSRASCRDAPTSRSTTRAEKYMVTHNPNGFLRRKR